MSMRQTIQIENPLASISTQHQRPIELSLEFPLFRKEVKADSWRKDITLTRIAEDGSSVSLRYLKSTQYEQETVEFSRGRVAIDTGNIDYTRGVGEYASNEGEFAAMLTLGAKLLAQVTQDIGTLPADAVDPLLQAVTQIKSNGARGSARESRVNN